MGLTNNSNELIKERQSLITQRTWRLAIKNNTTRLQTILHHRIQHKQTDKSNSPHLHISPKDDSRRISSATNKHQMHLQQLLRWDARACQPVVQIPRSFIGLETRANVSLCVEIDVAHSCSHQIENYYHRHLIGLALCHYSFVYIYVFLPFVAY